MRIVIGNARLAKAKSLRHSSTEARFTLWVALRLRGVVVGRRTSSGPEFRNAKREVS